MSISATHISYPAQLYSTRVVIYVHCSLDTYMSMLLDEEDKKGKKMNDNGNYISLIIN